MTKQEVLNLMKSSKSISDWESKCKIVKSAHNGKYPDYWYREIILKDLKNVSIEAQNKSPFEKEKVLISN